MLLLLEKAKPDPEAFQTPGGAYLTPSHHGLGISRTARRNATKSRHAVYKKSPAWILRGLGFWY